MRVLGCGYKVLETFDENMKLEDIEHGLKFLGFPVLENLLRYDAVETIHTLRSKKIHCTISTGDNVYTGLTVGKTVGVVDSRAEAFTGDYVNDEVVWTDKHGNRLNNLKTKEENFELAISGNLLEYFLNNDPSLFEELSSNCKVFGRMTPKHKIMLVESFQTEDVMVAMVGDGANDCGALKQADVGLSLSDAEASIAAPFSAKDLNSIIYILQEGRCSLVTCFQSFKFIVAYSILELHVIIMMHYEKTALTNNQYIYYDAINVFPLTFTMAASLPYHRLSKHLPPGSVLSPQILISVFGMMVVNTLITLTGLLALRSFSWYDVDKVYENPSYVNWGAPTIQGNAIFCQGGSQLIIIAAVFSFGKPYREAIYKNIPFLIAFFLLLVLDVYLILDRSEATFYVLEMYSDCYMSYRWAILGIFIGGSIVIYIFEVYGVPFMVKAFKKNRKRFISVRNN
jgi:cation-transporting ATPase 13A3/4/5